MCIRWVKVNRLLFGILCIIPLLTACPSQSADDVKPSLSLIGDADRTVSTNSIIIEGELEDNTAIASFSYSLNGGKTENIIDALGETLYRFIITDLQKGENVIVIKASDSSGNSISQELKVSVTSLSSTSVDGAWQDSSISYTACSKPTTAILSLHFDVLQQSSALGGSVELTIDGSVVSGHFQGYSEDGVISGALTLDNNYLPLGQLSLRLEGDMLTGSAIFKDAVACSSTSTEDISFDLELVRTLN
jgi:hypothetical protein